MEPFLTVDLIVIGAGHAGCEAALAASRLGLRTALLTMTLDSLANMPCNPNIGGTAKGQLVREIDALGGVMGQLADRYGIQFRMLNRSKGPAVLSPRAQIDRTAYQRGMKALLEKQEGLLLVQGEAVDLLALPSDAENRPWRLQGVRLRDGRELRAESVILATGTFLESKVIIGEASMDSGPDGLQASHGLSRSLRKLGLPLLRFKTGTPARLHARSLDLEALEIQENDEESRPFSYENELDPDWQAAAQLPCYLTWTNEETRRVVMDNIHRSPLYSGDIKGIGPRYCPSIEDKFVKFPDHERHHVFLEPTGLDTQEIYASGLSSSLPVDVQLALYRSIRGLERAELMRLAYAIEYDLIDPTALDLSLECRAVDGLFCAGQINGSSGYEEAAAQGLIAGINAARKHQGQPPYLPSRSEAYIGVLIDDLVTKGTNEPYRMMTARAEYRLLLRQDNADQRLSEAGYRLGLLSETRYACFRAKLARLAWGQTVLAKRYRRDEALLDFLTEQGTAAPADQSISARELLKRPQITLAALLSFDPELLPIRQPQDEAEKLLSSGFLSPSEAETLEIEIKYEGYMRMEEERIARFQKNEAQRIPTDLVYEELTGLRLEARKKLAERRPLSIGQASRISGVSPADLAVLLVAVKAHERRARRAQEEEEIQ